MKIQPEVIGLGGSAVDYLAVVPRFPKRDEKMRMLEFSRQGGGPVATALVTLARLGIPTGYVGKVGGDDFGSFILEGLREEGIDVSRVSVDKKVSSLFAFLIVEKKTGTRTALWTDGERSPLKISELDEGYLLGGKILHLDGRETEAAIWAAEKARRKGSKVVLDLDAAIPGIGELIGLADVVIPSRSIALELTNRDHLEDAADKLLSMGPELVVITLGEKGCLCKSRKETLLEAGIQMKVVDTTGAGDVFHGAFIYGILKGWGLRKIARFSNIVAGMKCSKLGGRAGIPTLSQALHFLEKSTMGEVRN